MVYDRSVGTGGSSVVDSFERGGGRMDIRGKDSSLGRRNQGIRKSDRGSGAIRSTNSNRVERNTELGSSGVRTRVIGRVETSRDTGSETR